MNEMKRCSRCKEVKSIDNFGVSNKSLDKHQNYCKNCSREYARDRRKSPEVAPKDTELKEIKELKMQNKKLKNRFKKILNLYLNDTVIS